MCKIVIIFWLRWRAYATEYGGDADRTPGGYSALQEATSSSGRISSIRPASSRGSVSSGSRRRSRRRDRRRSNRSRAIRRDHRRCQTRPFQRGHADPRNATAGRGIERLAADGIVVRSLPSPNAVRTSIHALDTTGDVDRANSLLRGTERRYSPSENSPSSRCGHDSMRFASELYSIMP